MIGIGNLSLMVILLSCLQSGHIRHEPSFFVITPLVKRKKFGYVE
jgi:hypothetical protein